MERGPQTIQIKRAGSHHYQVRVWAKVVVRVNGSEEAMISFGEETELTLQPGEHRITLNWPDWHVVLVMIGLFEEPSTPYVIRIPSSGDVRLCSGVREVAYKGDSQGGSFFGRLEIWEC